MAEEKVTGYDADGNPVAVRCEICGAESSVAFFAVAGGHRCLSCYTKYGSDYDPWEVD
jgi:hypothetical protein